MSYRVIRSFHDLQDDMHLYRVGDTYPRAGSQPSAQRITALESGNNAGGKIYIKKEGDGGNGSGSVCNSSGNTVTDENSDNAGATKSRKSPADRKRKVKDSSK